jgi:hypothetical protein
VRRLPSVLPLRAYCSTAPLRTSNIRNASAGAFIQAIERHENEAAEEAARFRRLSHPDKKLTLQFLRSL